MSRPVKLFSCDTHLEFAASEWIDYVDPAYRGLVDLEGVTNIKGVLPSSGPGGIPLNLLGGYQRFSEVDFGKLNPFDRSIPGSYGTPQQYLEWLDMDGIDAAVVLPGVSAGVAMRGVAATGNRDAYVNVIQGYNNWVSDYCAGHPARLLGAACLPTTGVDDAVAELMRVRKLPGIATVAPSAFPNGGSAPLPEDDRFWECSLALDMPITFHGGISRPDKLNTTWDVAVQVIGHVEVSCGGPYSAAQLILSGVFDRFPTLRFIIHEAGAGWVPFMMGRMDHMFYRYRWWAGMELKQAPSWYCTNGNFLYNFIHDRSAILLRHEVGVGNLTWSSDFPHSHSDWPWSRLRLGELLAPVPEDEQHEILWGNAARFYRLEDEYGRLLRGATPGAAATPVPVAV